MIFSQKVDVNRRTWFEIEKSICASPASGETRSELVAKSWAVNIAGCLISCSDDVNNLPRGKQHAENIQNIKNLPSY